MLPVVQSENRQPALGQLRGSIRTDSTLRWAATRTYATTMCGHSIWGTRVMDKLKNVCIYESIDCRFRSFLWQQVAVKGQLQPPGRHSAGGGVFTGASYLVINGGLRQSEFFGDTHMLDLSSERFYECKTIGEALVLTGSDRTPIMLLRVSSRKLAIHIRSKFTSPTCSSRYCAHCTESARSDGWLRKVSMLLR